jgi:hypothetical protein
LKSGVDQTFENGLKSMQAFENNIFWKAFVFEIKHTPFLNDFKSKDFESHFSFEDRELLPFLFESTMLF